MTFSKLSIFLFLFFSFRSIICQTNSYSNNEKMGITDSYMNHRKNQFL